MSIISTNIQEITLNSKIINISTTKGDLIVDIKKLLKEPINSDKAYFNATRVSEFFGRKKELNAFMKMKSTKEYIKILEDEFKMITRESRNEIKTHYLVRGSESKKGDKTLGTYLHNELFLKYLSWCDVRFEREIHKIIKHLIIHSNELKIERNNTKALFKPLTQSIKDIYIPAQISSNAKKFAYSSLLTLANIKVLGSSAKKYAKDNDIEIDNNKTIRDYLSKEILEEITKIEEDINGYIKYAKITDYGIIKDELGMK